MASPDEKFVLCRWPKEQIGHLKWTYCAKPNGKNDPMYCPQHRARLPLWPVEAK